MRKPLAAAVVLSLFLFTALLAAQEPSPGEALFKKHCSVCHPQGGNIINPKKTLSKKDREANGIVTAEDIVRKMRNPGFAPTHPQEWSGMKVFDAKEIPDSDALRIANYILETFK